MLDARDVAVGSHPDSYIVDKSALPMNRYIF